MCPDCAEAEDNSFYLLAQCQASARMRYATFGLVFRLRRPIFYYYKVMIRRRIRIGSWNFQGSTMDRGSLRERQRWAGQPLFTCITSSFWQERIFVYIVVPIMHQFSILQQYAYIRKACDMTSSWWITVSIDSR